MKARPALVAFVVLAVFFAACASASVASVDGTAITETQLSELHVDVNQLAEDDLVGSILLLVLHQAFLEHSESDFGIALDETIADTFYADRTARWPNPDEVELGLASRNERPDRLRMEAELDAIREEVSAHLVRTEAAGFDLDKAYNDYLLDNAHVCVLHIQLETAELYDEAEARLSAGESFAEVALAMSIDPFVGRQDGGSGASGDLGCSAPSALPVGMDTAVLEAPIGEAYGPITSVLGAHLIWVVERDAPALADVRPAVVEDAVTTQGPNLFQTWAIEVLQNLEVEVADQYGTWGMLPETDPVPTVVPPSRISQIVDP